MHHIFDHHKTLGEFILIDRLTNMTSACGVITGITEGGGNEGSVIFEDGDSKIYADLFDEYVYDNLTKNIKKIPAKELILKPGDILPLKGEGYEYPKDMDIECKDKYAIIRDGYFKGISSDKKGDTLVSPEGFKIDGKMRSFEAYRKIIIR